MTLWDPAVAGKYLCHQAEVAEDAQPAWGWGELEHALNPVPGVPSPKYIISILGMSSS